MNQIQDWCIRSTLFVKKTYKHFSKLEILTTFVVIGALRVNQYLLHIIKPALSGPSKIDKTKVLKANGSLMVESIAECSKGSILQYFWPALTIELDHFWVFGMRMKIYVSI